MEFRVDEKHHEHDDERDDDEPDDKAGGAMSGEVDVGVEGFHFKASFRSWLMVAGVVALGFLTGLLRLIQAIVELMGHMGHDKK